MTKQWNSKQQKESKSEGRNINRLANKKDDFSVIEETDRQKTFHVKKI